MQLSETAACSDIKKQPKALLLGHPASTLKPDFKEVGLNSSMQITVTDLFLFYFITSGQFLTPVGDGSELHPGQILYLTKSIIIPSSYLKTPTRQFP